MDELWKPIPDTDYAVSNTGKVASMKKGWRVMKASRDGRGYLKVVLCDKHGGQRTVKVHHLVAEAFLGPRPTPKHQTNHIDGVKQNNFTGNLEWVTRLENMRHYIHVLGHRAARGEQQGSAKVTEVDVREIRQRRAAGERLTVIAADYGITAENAGLIANGKSWAWLADNVFHD